MEIEPATQDDLETVVDLWVALAIGQQTYGSHLAAEENRDTIRLRIANHVLDGTLLVARTPDIVGFVMFELEHGALVEDVTRGRIHNVYVTRDARSNGIGTALLDAAETALIDRGATVITLEAMADNDTAIEFYTDRGYEPHRIEYELTVATDTEYLTEH